MRSLLPRADPARGQNLRWGTGATVCSAVGGGIAPSAPPLGKQEPPRDQENTLKQGVEQGEHLETAFLTCFKPAYPQSALPGSDAACT